MDPTTGTFLSVDPLVDMRSPQHHNPYSYAANNPVSNVDPTGALPVPVVAGLVAGGVNFAVQLASNDFNVSKVNFTEVGVAAVAGTVSVAKIGVATANQIIASGIVANTAETVVNAKIEGKAPTAQDLKSDVISGGAAGAATKLLPKGRTAAAARHLQVLRTLFKKSGDVVDEMLEEGLETDDSGPSDSSQPSSPSTTPTGAPQSGAAASVDASGLAGLAGAGSALSSAPVQYSPPPAAPPGNPTVTIYDQWCPLGC